MAQRHVIHQVLREVGRQRPVTAALGELSDPTAKTTLPDVLRYVKLGLARASADWRDRLDERARALGAHRFIVAAYADHARVAAPSIDDVLDWAIQHRVAGLLIDTAIKGKDKDKDSRGRPGLFHWCEPAALRTWIEAAHGCGMLVALAGSLDEAALPLALETDPDVIAVRGAACAQADRNEAVQCTLVRRLKRSLATCTAPALACAG